MVRLHLPSQLPQVFGTPIEEGAKSGFQNLRGVTKIWHEKGSFSRYLMNPARFHQIIRWGALFCYSVWWPPEKLTKLNRVLLWKKDKEGSPTFYLLPFDTFFNLLETNESKCLSSAGPANLFPKTSPSERAEQNHLFHLKKAVWIFCLFWRQWLYHAEFFFIGRFACTSAEQVCKEDKPLNSLRKHWIVSVSKTS